MTFFYKIHISLVLDINFFNITIIILGYYILYILFMFKNILIYYSSI